MQNMGLNEIRERYLAFFESKGHLRLPSFSLVPENDPSILLINAGMTPLKPYFTGAQTPPRKRVTTCQKCIRTPDIDRVGLTARHGTFFEMLGNFSFGDYFKKEVIPWSWEFSTKVLGLEPERISVTVYQDDGEAYDIWHNVVGLPAERIFRMGKEDNFWEHGTGPCGPCSELFYDRGPEHGCGKADCTVGCDCDRYIEYWNLVFTQFDRQEDGTYLPLENKNIDTGAGLERIACIMQGVENLFETDTVRAVLNRVCELANLSYGQSEKQDVGIRVVTDHIRSGTMMISDGIRPSNEGRGYVLRRLLRRALRYGRMLGIDGAFLTRLAPVVIAQSEIAYPELRERESYILSVLSQEESSFEKTVSQGSDMLETLIAGLKAAGQNAVPGNDVFRLHDTYGFPMDLTREIAAEQGLTIDEAGFRDQMAIQKKRSKAAAAQNGGSAWGDQMLPEAIARGEVTAFVGYDQLTVPAEVLYIVEQDSNTGAFSLSAGAAEGTDCLIVTDRTPFYAAAGGQVGDRGRMTGAGIQLLVRDTTKTAEGVYLHHAVVETGFLKPGQLLELAVDTERRMATTRNHSATHLLHKALHDLLGEHATQAGSSVNPDRLRFDFHYGKPLTAEQISGIESSVNQAILADYPVVTDVMDLESARQSGAMALFDEKYGDRVRIVRMGNYSSEFCGGTHLSHTSQACFFKILSESSVASGVRRIEAVTGAGAFRLANDYQRDLQLAAASLKTTLAEVPARVETVLEDLKRSEKRFADLERARAADAAGDLVSRAVAYGDIRALCAALDVPDAAVLRETADRLREQLKPAVVVLASVSGPKVLLIAMASPEAVAAGVHSGNIVKAAAAACGGGGGGRPDMAQAGGKQPEQVEQAIQAAQDVIARQLG